MILYTCKCIFLTYVTAKTEYYKSLATYILWLSGHYKLYKIVSWKTKCVKANSFLSTKLYTSPWNQVINIFNFYFVFICSGNLASTRPDFTLRYSTWCRFLTCNNLIAAFVNNIILLVKRFKLFNLAEILFNLSVGVNCLLYKGWILPLNNLFLGCILNICYQLWFEFTL